MSIPVPSRPDDASLQELAPAAETLPVISFAICYFDGSPEEARRVAHALARALIPEATRILERDHPKANLRIAVAIR